MLNTPRERFIAFLVILVLLWASYELGRASMEADIRDRDEIQKSSPKLSPTNLNPMTRIF